MLQGRLKRRGVGHEHARLLKSSVKKPPSDSASAFRAAISDSMHAFPIASSFFKSRRSQPFSRASISGLGGLRGRDCTLSASPSISEKARWAIPAGEPLDDGENETRYVLTVDMVSSGLQRPECRLQIADCRFGIGCLRSLFLCRGGNTDYNFIGG